MNYFKFSDTLGGYSLRYQEPTPGGEERKLVYIIGDKTCGFQFKISSAIYITGNQSQNK